MSLYFDHLSLIIGSYFSQLFQNRIRYTKLDFVSFLNIAQMLIKHLLFLLEYKYNSENILMFTRFSKRVCSCCHKLMCTQTSDCQYMGQHFSNLDEIPRCAVRDLASNLSVDGFPAKSNSLDEIRRSLGISMIFTG